MMDLESVHMAYLTDTKRICFLSGETLSISNNIERILQCALDFRSCLVNGVGDFQSDNQGLIDHISQINISQVSLIKKNFDENLKELHSSYLKSPKHGEFGLARFWTCLNYNGYYSDALGNDMCTKFSRVLNNWVDVSVATTSCVICTKYLNITIAVKILFRIFQELHRTPRRR
ncbi:uncharacterized protein LOC110723421 isoform X1 [Chenopodium quinoa]|uniref:uncharacterized protein LOC110723421 isoform X1 n=1 Tax=Chenopodium quinoa TaxID=63459 RepID=UPI000B78CF51|nr:uncharacterized protein LOC110723421 isoform X1 [Chenopodium quinoa]XP_021758469.1 uncharacterized protein LOC110723421 isoform X1 [Chenopodium quinoa]